MKTTREFFEAVVGAMAFPFVVAVSFVIAVALGEFGGSPVTVKK